MNLRSETHTGIGRVAVAATLAGLLGVSAIAHYEVIHVEGRGTAAHGSADGNVQRRYLHAEGNK